MPIQRVPIVCAWCVKERGARGLPPKVLGYSMIDVPPGVKEPLSHGICAECQVKYFPGVETSPSPPQRPVSRLEAEVYGGGMMPEPIGKGCECVYAFEKHYVDLALEQIIRENERTIEGHETALQDSTLTERQATLLRGSLEVFRYVNNDMKTVKQRFADMSVCT